MWRRPAVRSRCAALGQFPRGGGRAEPLKLAGVGSARGAWPQWTEGVMEMMVIYRTDLVLIGRWTQICYVREEFTGGEFLCLRRRPHHESGAARSLSWELGVTVRCLESNRF